MGLNHHSPRVCVFDSEFFSGSTTVCSWGCHHLRASMSGLFYILYIIYIIYNIYNIYIYIIYIYPDPSTLKHWFTMFYPLIVAFFGGDGLEIFIPRIECRDLFSSHGSQQTSNAETSPCNCDLYRWSLIDQWTQWIPHQGCGHPLESICTSVPPLAPDDLPQICEVWSGKSILSGCI